MNNKVTQLPISEKTALAVLVDPDKVDSQYLEKLIYYANNYLFDYLFVGGSIVFKPICKLIDFLKSEIPQPIVLFPGDLEQLCLNADYLLFLSLISGRNPEYLIGKHVISAHKIANSKVKVIPTGYILIGDNNISTVQYITQTMPIPSDNWQLAVATALAGQLLGFRAIYLEAGSNSNEPVKPEIIQKVRNHIDITLIVGGGIKTPEQALATAKAGADIIVIGSILEQNIDLLPKFAQILNNKQ